MYLALFDFSHLVDTYGYWSVFVFVAIGSAGIPFPGSAVLMAAAVYAGATHHLNIALVIAAGAAGAIVGSSIGYWLGRRRGFSLLLHGGRYLRLDERRLKTGYYLSTKHGGKVLFFGRFVSLVRPWVGFFAGASHMGTARFMVINVSGASLWASVLGLGAYLLGDNNHRVTGPLGVAIAVLVVLLIIAAIRYARRHYARVAQEAEQAIPGPLPENRPDHSLAQ